jgi:hypothetical protein
MARRQEGAVVVRQPGLHRDQRPGDCVLDGCPDVDKAVAVAPHPLPASCQYIVTDPAACVDPCKGPSACNMICMIQNRVS